MFNKTQLAILICCISTASHAYLIKSDFTVENKTEVPLTLKIFWPNPDKPITQPVLPGTPVRLSVDNDQYGTGWLNQTKSARFMIVSTDEKLVYAQGRVNFYIDGLWRKRSFLDAVTFADGLEKSDKSYSCYSGAWDSFNSSIVINGVPEKGLPETDFPASVTCQGLKSSVTSDDYKYYSPTCFNGANITFERVEADFASAHGSKTCFADFCFNYVSGTYKNGYKYYVDVPASSVDHNLPDTQAIQKKLNEIGNTFCETTGSEEVNYWG